MGGSSNAYWDGDSHAVLTRNNVTADWATGSNAGLSLEASKACLRRADMLVTTDSGPRHIASAFDVPTVVLFGPIDPAWSYNYASHTMEMFDQLDCSPCGKRVCPLGHHQCMNDLTPARVHNAVHRLFGEFESERAA